MINALMYVEKLEQTGFTSEQAKTSVGTWLELMNDNLVTKHELKLEMTAARHEMLAKFSDVQLEFKNVHIMIEAMEKRLIKVIVGSAGFMAAIMGIIISLTR